jgi:hypothetical protein
MNPQDVYDLLLRSTRRDEGGSLQIIGAMAAGTYRPDSVLHRLKEEAGRLLVVPPYKAFVRQDGRKLVREDAAEHRDQIAPLGSLRKGGVICVAKQRFIGIRKGAEGRQSAFQFQQEKFRKLLQRDPISRHF